MTDYAFRDLGWPHLWLSNDERNHPSRGSRKSKERGWSASSPSARSSGEGRRMVWLIEREAYLKARATAKTNATSPSETPTNQACI